MRKAIFAIGIAFLLVFSVCIGLAEKTAPRETVCYDESPSLLKPESYEDIVQIGAGKLSKGGEVLDYYFLYKPTGKETDISETIQVYVDGLKADGYEVTGKRSFVVRNGTVKLCTVSADGTKMKVEIVPGNETLKEKPQAVSETAKDQPPSPDPALPAEELNPASAPESASVPDPEVTSAPTPDPSPEPAPEATPETAAGPVPAAAPEPVSEPAAVVIVPERVDFPKDIDDLRGVKGLSVPDQPDKAKISVDAKYPDFRVYAWYFNVSGNLSSEDEIQLDNNHITPGPGYRLIASYSQDNQIITRCFTKKEIIENGISAEMTDFHFASNEMNYIFPNGGYILERTISTKNGLETYAFSTSETSRTYFGCTPTVIPANTWMHFVPANDGVVITEEEPDPEYTGKIVDIQIAGTLEILDYPALPGSGE